MSTTPGMVPNTPSTPTTNGTRLPTYTSSGSKNRHQQNRKQRGSGGFPKAISTTSRIPANQYLSLCCQAPARKPQAGRKESAERRTKEQPKGLGHWHCSNCGKPTKVTVMKVSAIIETTKTTEVNNEA